MEFLHPHARLSVPEIARRYKVSRQHVQVTVNKLLDQGLLASEENAKHKRSSLIRLSRAGRERFGEIQHTEVVLVDKLFADLSGSDIDVTHRTLRRLLDRLNLGDQ
jgi:DNA-binding MarR family transcriptional regulator